DRARDARRERREKRDPFENFKAPVVPVLSKPLVAVAPPGPPQTAVVDKGDDGEGVGSLVEPATGERFFVMKRELRCDRRDVTLGATVEFTAVQDKFTVTSGGRTADRLACHVTLAKTPLAVEATTYVVEVRDGFGFLKHPNPRNQM